MRRVLLAVVVASLASCADEGPRTSTESFCSVVQELDEATDASLAAVFGQGFDAPVLTPDQVEEGLGRLRDLDARLGEAAPDDAPGALGRYLGIRSEYMDAVEEGGFEPDPDNLDEEDPRVRAWEATSTRAIEDETGRYIRTTCPAQ